MSEYPATLDYLKLLLAGVTDLTEAADADLANPQLMADLSAFRDGERDDLPTGRTLVALNALTAKPTVVEHTRLQNSACAELQRNDRYSLGPTERALAFSIDSVDGAFVKLQRQCCDELESGMVYSIPRFAAFWEFVCYERFVEQFVGPLRTSRRPRNLDEYELAGTLKLLLTEFSESWHWDQHNLHVNEVRRLEKTGQKYSPGMTPEQLADYRLDREELADEHAIHYRDGLLEQEIRGLLSHVCPQCLKYLPVPIPANTLVNREERSKEYRDLEGQVLAQLKTTPPLISKAGIRELPTPATMPTTTPTATGDGNGTNGRRDTITGTAVKAGPGRRRILAGETTTIKEASDAATSIVMQAVFIAKNYREERWWMNEGTLTIPALKFGDFLRETVEADRMVRRVAAQLIDAKRDDQVVRFGKAVGRTAHHTAIKFARQLGLTIIDNLWTDGEDGPTGTVFEAWPLDGLMGKQHLLEFRFRWQDIRDALAKVELGDLDEILEVIKLEAQRADAILNKLKSAIPLPTDDDKPPPKNGKAKPKKRGRPIVYDKAFDKRVFDAWHNSGLASTYQFVERCNRDRSNLTDTHYLDDVLFGLADEFRTRNGREIKAADVQDSINRARQPPRPRRKKSGP